MSESGQTVLIGLAVVAGLYLFAIAVVWLSTKAAIRKMKARPDLLSFYVSGISAGSTVLLHGNQPITTGAMKKELQDQPGGVLPSLLCPKENGGCGYWAWQVTLDRANKRVILDCANCGYRTSLPLDMGRLNDGFTGPLDESGAVVKR